MPVKELRSMEGEEIKEASKKAQEILAKIPLEEIINAIRSSREER